MSRAERRKAAHDSRTGRLEVARLRGVVARAELALVGQRKAVAAYLSKVDEGGDRLYFARQVLDRAFGSPFTAAELHEYGRLLDLEIKWREEEGGT